MSAIAFETVNTQTAVKGSYHEEQAQSAFSKVTSEFVSLVLGVRGSSFFQVCFISGTLSPGPVSIHLRESRPPFRPHTAGALV